MIFLKDLECVCEILYTFVTLSLTLKKQSINNEKI
ncbi:hypothetical protein SAMN04488541_10336 [Thermoflexibacter ruber]|uniref:Uncharacterized protein n=1 Tax=Thermoflexibacter ruber TaxID=1003 RepID=A0A1I2IKV9_9BACT|nr:hypothetical protein SAMN04488541_10336 [Thermoflexibacter ruber]